MHTVLGFATTKSSIECVRIEKSGVGDASVTRESLHAAPLGGDTAGDAYAHLTARVWFRMRRLSHVDEHPVRAVGVTWTEGADHEATLLVEALTAAGLANVVAIEAGEASRELARARAPASDPVASAADGLVGWLHAVVARHPASAAPQAQSELAMGAAVAAAHGARPPRASAARSTWRHWPWRQTRTTAGLFACGLALLVSLSLSTELRHPSGPPAHQPQVDTTPGGPVVVPASSAPVLQVPSPEPPPAPAPDTAEVSLSPPAAPEPPAGTTLPAPQAPLMPAPGNQIAPPIPDPMPVEQAPPEPNCFLLCGITL
ncbi:MULTISPECIES: hypothetical protein [unclassified Mycobacterium]|uniref:hypothetical protein n=1 Tax=unclassified Mycobacterium TaxID=2642494 RepID=UPI0029C7A0F6|nr:MULTISPECIES: hypothetical protein [unclassified Mycobacterium]